MTYSRSSSCRPRPRFDATVLASTVVAIGLAASARAATPPGTLWARQLGSPVQDVALGVAADTTGNAYVTGRTTGALAGPFAGGSDAFLARYDADGSLAWARQFGTGFEDIGNAVAVDPAGSAYVAGLRANASGQDASLAKFDASGTLLWTRPIATAEGDEGYGVAVDAAGNAYVAGRTGGPLAGAAHSGRTDAFLQRYAADGSLVWTRQFGTGENDVALGIDLDAAGNPYVSGYTAGPLFGPNGGSHDAFVARFDADDGATAWARQFGSPINEQDYGTAVAVDGAGHAYVVGETYGPLAAGPAGRGDTYLARYDADGTLAWVRQLGTAAQDIAYAVAVDAAGKVYVTGTTEGGIAGDNLGNTDGFLLTYDADGNLVASSQVGTAAHDGLLGVVAVGADRIYLAGFSSGDLGGGQPAGPGDAVLIAVAVPEPATLTIVTGVAVSLTSRRRVVQAQSVRPGMSRPDASPRHAEASQAPTGIDGVADGTRDSAGASTAAVGGTGSAGRYRNRSR